ncbi:MAG: 3-phosphoshikimate 1-carboxyvinyltransferase [Bacteroidetes bacterium]|nr:3-phosphoshikimate 1-carboxyvinyltransferase [Bacteroidota bacterium]MBS1758228.1 3-phosphoshikimate 1-carboxyvinyltransferase [Bacteroidota bacterium]
MKVTIQPTVLKGEIFAAASKSAMQRACAAALLHHGHTNIINPGKSNDDIAALSIIKNLGAFIQQNADGSISIESLHYPAEDAKNKEINCGESGLSIRMFVPIAALNSAPIQVTGSGSLLTRPMDFFDEILPKLSVQIQSNAGRLPLHLQGPLLPGDITIDGSLSSQFLTGLLMAFAKAATKQVTITVINLKSKPYIDLTLQIMKLFGYEVKNENYERFIIQPQPRFDKDVTYTVEGDWSGAAFLLVAGAIAGDIKVKGLDIQSAQADKAILNALILAKAAMKISDNEIELHSKSLEAFEFDATDCPDLFPPLVALAVYCQGTTVIKGVSRLAHKESNRALTLQQEFAKMGVTILLEDDVMKIEGGGKVHGAALHSRHDHRIAMAGAIAALRAEGFTTIDEADAINKSYPDFYEHIKHLGASVSINQ